MREFLSDKEKRILFAALRREKEICIKIDNESYREPYEISLEKICNRLQYLFEYDKIFILLLKDIEENINEITSDIENKCLDHTENENGEWETITFNYSDWAEMMEKLEQIGENI